MSSKLQPQIDMYALCRVGGATKPAHLKSVAPAQHQLRFQRYRSKHELGRNADWSTVYIYSEIRARIYSICHREGL